MQCPFCEFLADAAQNFLSSHSEGLFIFNEWGKKEQMFPVKNSCSFSVCTALAGVRQGWEEAHHWRWFGGWIQSAVHSTTEWIWMDSHTKPWYAWYATRLTTFTLCKRANSKFPCVRKGQLRKVCLLCCFPLLSAFPFQPRILPGPHTGLLNQMFAEQVELSRILGYTMIHLPVPSCANVMVRRCSKILEIPCGNRIGYRGRRSWRAQQTLSCRAHCLGADVTTENPCDIMQLYAIISSTLKHFDDVFLCFSAIFHYVIMFTVHLLWDSECSEVVGHSKKGEAWRLELTFDELILTALGLVTRHATLEK